MQKPIFGSHVSRRSALQHVGLGLGGLAYSILLAEEMAAVEEAKSRSGRTGNPLLPKTPAFPAKAKRVIHIFLNGGPSQVDTFDPKPQLATREGKTMTDGEQEVTPFPSPFKFQKHGQSGLEISELFPQLAKHADDLCMIRSMHTDVPDHEASLRMLTCGDSRLPRPSMGSWMLYGLGTENESLPGFVAMCPGGLPLEADHWQSAFLPAIYQGCHVDTNHRDVERMLESIRSPHATRSAQRTQLDFVRQMNERHAQTRAEDDRLDARLRAYELAFAMQVEAAEAFDVSREPQRVRELYGTTSHGRQMLIARRLVERGVRYVQVWHGDGVPWDTHENIAGSLPELARETDQPIAALLADLKRTGLINDTLVIIGGEFGRTPYYQQGDNSRAYEGGRDHNNRAFTTILAGAGVKRGIAYGATDEFGLAATENKVHVHDLHATILHLLGFDHEKLTYRYAGRDFRLTDVHGDVVQGVLA